MDAVTPPPTATGAHAHCDALLARCQGLAPVRTAIVHPVQANVLEAARDAVEAGLIAPTLVGPKARILDAAKMCDVDISVWPLIDVEHSHAAAARAAELARAGRVDAIMKGALHSDELLGAIVHPDSGLRTERRISHAYLMDIASYPKPFIITDAAINIAPDLAAKADILQNAIDLWHVLFGPSLPKAAILAAVETVNPKMIATLDAAALCKMADRRQITGAVVDGPLALDNAIDAEAAREKGIVSEVAGQADILLVPDIEAGNMLAKQLTFLGHADAAGIVLGARAPIMLTSRADSLRTRMLSCALAVLLVEARHKGQIL
ncbi:MAG: bifunctional enoyl-CoA hydratase/phosphate acetyltransferase [Asticcacaulis sp.]|uniref:bifunctional enoyl-CoA hydratase/phosphate acetyltransferase n=1 Tax=Asticcacaulis sp. TaxID=1872648 RepID=UPI003F7BBA0F